MKKNVLSSSAMQVINNYLKLPFDNDRHVACPYFNNRRTNIRAALRVMIGKGSPLEIVEEAALFALRDRVDIKPLTDDALKKFLIDHGLGIDCSGLVYHILDVEVMQKTNKTLKRFLKFPLAKTPLRKLLTKLRPVENCGVKNFAHEANSTAVSLADPRPGDIITMLEAERAGTPDHILIVHQIETESSSGQKTIHYTHALPWSTDGQYDHGVRQGIIRITNPTDSLLEQVWEETKATGEKNETLKRAKESKNVSLRRLKALA